VTCFASIKIELARTRKCVLLQVNTGHSTHAHKQITNNPQKIYELNESANLVNQTKRKHNNENTFVHEYWRFLVSR